MSTHTKVKHSGQYLTDIIDKFYLVNLIIYEHLCSFSRAASSLIVLISSFCNGFG